MARGSDWHKVEPIRKGAYSTPWDYFPLRAHTAALLTQPYVATHHHMFTVEWREHDMI